MKTKIISYLGPSGSRLYRWEQIAKYLNRTDRFEVLISPNAINDKELLWADVIFVQSLVDPKQIADIWAYKMERGKIILTDRDDAISVQDDNPFLKDHIKYHAPSWTKELLKVSDAVTVTTQTLADEVKEYNADVTVIPNYLDMEMWDMPPVKNESGMVRIGFSGSVTHRNDFAMVAPVIKKVLSQRAQAKFILCGDAYLMKFFEDIPHKQWEFIDGTANVYGWAAKAHSLALDIGIAPQLDTHFNRSRSYLKFLEYGMTETVGVFSPPAYKDHIKDYGFLASTPEEWEKHLLYLIDNPQMRKKMGREVRRYVRRSHDVSRHIDKYERIIQRLQSSKSQK